MWALYYRGLARSATGDLAAGRDDLVQCLRHARDAGNQQAIAWAQVTLSSFHLHDDLAAADRYADQCEQTIERYGRMPLCRVRLEWHRAELARARGDHPLTRTLLRVVSKHPRAAPQTYGAPYMSPYVHAVEAELARTEHDPSAVRLIDETIAEFRAGGWGQQVARMQVSRWFVTRRRSSPPAALVRRCVRNGYGLELNAVTSNLSSGYLPLHPF